MMEFVVISLILLILGREYLSYKERKDLYNRLMARNLQEVRVMEESKTPVEVTSPDTPPEGYVQIEDVDEKVFDEFIQDTLNPEPTLKQKAISKLKRKAK